MPQEPKKKHSKARKNTRRAAIKLVQMLTVKCQNCGKETLPHQACKSCGFYRGKQIGTKSQVEVTKA